jgi:hypothetical protein
MIIHVLSIISQAYFAMVEFEWTERTLKGSRGSISKAERREKTDEEVT